MLFRAPVRITDCSKRWSIALRLCWHDRLIRGHFMKVEGLHDSISIVRTQIEDLRAELEAGARYADRIHADVKIIDDRVVNHLRQTARMSALVESADELKKSIRDQRGILRDLRQSVDRIRQSIRDNKK